MPMEGATLFIRWTDCGSDGIAVRRHGADRFKKDLQSRGRGPYAKHCRFPRPCSYLDGQPPDFGTATGRDRMEPGRTGITVQNAVGVGPEGRSATSFSPPRLMRARANGCLPA